MNDEILLEIKNLEKSFAAQAVIRDLSLTVRRGERMALCAPSGAGKTTLIRILAGLEKADSGRVMLKEQPPVTIFQEPRLFPFMTVEENIYLPFKTQEKVIDPQVRRDCQKWLEVCELAAYKKHYPFQLSGGMKQKVSLVRALLGRPRFVLMDEPFQSIGSESKLAIIRHFLQTNPQVSLLFITHIREEVPLLAHRVVYFQQPCLSQALQMPAACYS
jgi:ABC-type nitrate/sulfonate/bicarbonate transport system ATPase subunit